MLEKEATIRFDVGAFSKAVIAPAPMEEGLWILQLNYKGSSRFAVIEKQRGGFRHFKTIDAACSTARKIGFRSLSVDLWT